MGQFSLYVHKGGLKPHSFHLFNKSKNDLYIALFLAFAEKCAGIDCMQIVHILPIYGVHH